MWKAKVLADGERNAVLRVWAASWQPALLAVGSLSQPQRVLGVADLRPPVDMLKIEHLVFSVSEGYEVGILWDEEPFLPLSGRGRFDFAELRGLPAGREMELFVSRPKVEVAPRPMVFMLFELLKQREA